jgi:hypothetical protein
MRRILILLLSCLPVIALAAPPKPFSAEYEVMRNGSRIGTGTISLAALPDGQWALETRSGARGGLAGAAGVRREERSLLRWTGTQFATVEYTMQQRAAWSTRNLSITIDSNARTASSTNRRETRQLPYRPGMLDRHALTAAIMVDLGAGKDGVLEYLVAERTDVETQRYDVAASVKLETALGVKRAVRVMRLRDDDSGRVTKIWFARENGWIPLRIKQYEADGETIDMRITAIR